MNKISILILTGVSALVLAIATACQTSKALNSSGIPSKKFLIGGGYNIDFTAPTIGIGYVVEEQSRRVIILKSLDKNERFRSEMELNDEEAQHLGIKASMARFTFYFVPLLEAIPALKGYVPRQ